MIHVGDASEKYENVPFLPCFVSETKQLRLKLNCIELKKTNINIKTGIE
jgi:hypothetical protein